MLPHEAIIALIEDRMFGVISIQSERRDLEDLVGFAALDIAVAPFVIECRCGEDSPFRIP
jgi:hypothetical protein